MAPLSTPRQLALADRCYRLLLLIYPSTFRRVYAAEMASTFRACWRETLSTEGSRGLLRLYASTLSDLIATTLKEHCLLLLSRLKRLAGRSSLALAPAGLDALLTAPLHLQIAQHTDIGCKRSTNEDNLITVLPDDPQMLQEKGALFVVADGMGGHNHGERASELAVTTVREAYYRDSHEEIAPSLVAAIAQANTIIYQENAAQPGDVDDQKGMGTTCIAAVLQEKRLVVANVGDSRVYVIHGGQIRQVSQDHSMVADMVRTGLLTEEQARNHEQRNVIYRSLGVKAEVEIDTFEESVENRAAAFPSPSGRG
jgi:serine/threonine protein phosphatase PrpC